MVYNFKVYTDGSSKNNGKSNNVGGWAYAIIENDEPVCVVSGRATNTTNQKMELLAAINALKDIQQRLGDSPIFSCIVYSDSAYLVRCYNEGWYMRWRVNGWVNSSKQPVANKELWEELIPFFEDHRFAFQKVKGHSTDKDEHSKFNNLVDEVAQAAAVGGK